MLQGFEDGVFLVDIVAASQDEEAYALRIGFSVAEMDAFIQLSVFSKAHKAKRNQNKLACSPVWKTPCHKRDAIISIVEDEVFRVGWACKLQNVIRLNHAAGLKNSFAAN